MLGGAERREAELQGMVALVCQRFIVNLFVLGGASSCSRWGEELWPPWRAGPGPLPLGALLLHSCPPRIPSPVTSRPRCCPGQGPDVLPHQVWGSASCLLSTTRHLHTTRHVIHTHSQDPNTFCTSPNPTSLPYLLSLPFSPTPSITQRKWQGLLVNHICI